MKTFNAEENTRHLPTSNSMSKKLIHALTFCTALATGAGVYAATNTLGSFDGTFESGLGGATSTGDVSLVSNVGILDAQEGTQALLMTTAPDAGSTLADATVSTLLLDDFTIDAQYATVRLSYNFLTNEPEPSFANDTFTVKLVLVTTSGEELLLSSDTFEGLSPAPWTGYTGQSGFATMVGDVSAVAGTGDVVRLELRIADVGDGRGDSAVLIDDLRLVEPGVPTASVRDPYVAIAPGEAFVFDGSGSSDDVGVVSWDWNFANGFAGFGPMVNFDQYTDQGFYQGTLTVTDDEGNTDTTTFTVVVGDPNSAPVITSNGNAHASEGVPYTYQIAATDNETQFGDVLTYSLDTGPAGMTIDSASGLVTWTPPVGGANTYPVTVSVADTSGASASQSYTIAMGPDLYVASIGDGGRIWTARSTGTGFDQFTELMDIHNSSRSRGVAIADFDGDGDFDLMSGERASDSARIELYLHPRENGAFGAPIYVGRFDPDLDPGYTMDFTAGDFDNDGDVDLIVHTNTRRSYYLENSGDFSTQTDTFFLSDFESGGLEGWGGAPTRTAMEVDTTTAANGTASLRVFATGTPTTLAVDINPSNWMLTRGSMIRFAYRIPPGVPVGLRFNISGHGWVQLGGSAAADPGPYAQPPIPVVLLDDDTWRTVEFDLYDLLRSIDPNASLVTEFELWTNNNATNGQEYWIDDVEIDRPQLINGFTESLLPDVGNVAWRAADSGDVDGDGNLDFIAGRSDAIFHVFTGDGAGGFTASGVVLDSGNDAYGGVLDDFDGDGVPDVIANNQNSGTTAFFKGNGDGTFQPGVLAPNLDFNNYASLGAYDFDGDGNVDVVSSTYTSQQMRFNRGNGDGTFQPSILIGQTTGSAVLAIAAPEGRAPGRPYAVATADLAVVTEGGTVNFDASGSYDDGAIVDYAWDFGNGATGNGVTASSTYNSEGPLNVVLTVTDDEGHVDRTQIRLVVTGTPPVADPGGPYSLDESDAVQGDWTVTVDGSGSSDAETGIVHYSWDFDAADGITENATGPLARWTYKATGVYTVTLTVRDEGELTHAATTTVTVSGNGAPAALITGPTGLDETDASLGEFVGWFAIDGATDDLGIESYVLDWGDGTSPTTFRPMSDNFSDDNLNGWNTTGTWSANNGEAVLSDTGAAWRWLQDQNREYEDFELEFDFLGVPSTGDGYVGIVFRGSTAASSTNAFLIYSRDSWGTWNFYDWQASGTLVTGTGGWDEGIWYHARLRVIGDDVEFYLTPEGGTETLVVAGSSSAHPRGGIALVGSDQAVRFDNVKVTPLDTTWTQNGSTVTELVHGFASVGNYDVTLTVTDHAKATDTDTVSLSVAGNDLPVAATGGPYTVDEAQAHNEHWTLALDLTGSSDDVGVERYVVDFGDGTSYTTGVSSGQATGYFAVGTDLYGYDTPDGNINRVIATEPNTLVELIDLDTNTVVSSTTLANPLSTWNGVSAAGNGYFKLRANKPVAAYFTDFSNHVAFLPSLDGTPVGREFIAYFDINSGMYVYAYEDSKFSVYNTSGALVFDTTLVAGTYAQIPVSGAVYRAVSSGRVSIQNTSGDGYSTVPSSSGDGVGQLFMFATTRTNGGSIAVMAHAAANIEVFDLDTGASLYTAAIAEGDVWFQHPVGLRRVRLVSDADVEVWAGDNEGSTLIAGLGDDLSMAGGRNGTEFRVHQLTDGFVIFAPNENTVVNINGSEVATLGEDEYLHLTPADLSGGISGVHHVVASRPIVIQTLGFANTLNNEGTYLGGATARHRYQATGTYDLTVTAVDRAGQTNTATTTVTVEVNDPPVPAFDAPAVADETFAAGGQWMVDFDAGTSTDDFGINTYSWDFGDGGSATGAQVSHAFGATGTYDVTLTVTDHAGQSVSTTRQIEITQGDGPVADAGGPYIIDESSASRGIWEIMFDGSGSSDDAGLFDYVWSFPNNLLDDFSVDGEPFSREFDSQGATIASGVLSITGANVWTNRGWRYRPTITRADAVEVRGQVYDDPANTLSNMMWGLYHTTATNYNYTQMRHAIYFNNGTLRIYENGSNRRTWGPYTRGVLYDVRIVLRDSGAEYFYREAGAADWIEISGVASLGATDAQMRVGATVQYGEWDFDNPTVDPLVLSGPFVSRFFREPVTNVPLSLTVRDNALQPATDTTTLTISSGDAPTADAGPDLTVEVGSMMNFNGTGSADDVEIERYEWDFGETTGGPDAPGSETANLPYTGQGPTPRYFYKTPGTYNVSLTVHDRVNQSATDTATVTVVVGDPPVAAASVVRAGAAGAPPVYFDAGASTDDYGIVQYRWDFNTSFDSDGDGDPANDLDGTGRTPMHFYQRATGGDTESFGFLETFSAPIDSADWNQVGATVSDGVGIVTGAGSWGTRYLGSTTTYPRSDQGRFEGEVMQPSGAGNEHVMVGLKSNSTSQSFSAMPHAIYFDNGILRIYEAGGNRGTPTNFSYSQDVWYEWRIDVKNSGADYYLRERDAGGPWVQLTGFSATARTDSPLRIHHVVHSGLLHVDNVRNVLPADRTIALTVVDGAGQTATTTLRAHIAPDLPPHVVTVPWVAFDPLVPHETYNGKAILLKGIVRDRDPVSYQWDFGDGTSSAVIPITNNRDLSVTHTYPDAPNGTPFIATLTVTDSQGNTGSATYPVVVKPKTLNTEINVAIDEGLWYLHTTMSQTTIDGFLAGFWTSNAQPSATASAIQAFEVNGHLESIDHRSNPYADTVQRGLRGLFTYVRQRAIATQTYGEPDTNGNGIGVEVTGSHPIYEGGQVMDAIASSGSPLTVAVTGPEGVKGRRYFDILQDMTDAFAWGQTEQGSGGAWRYVWNSSIDNSAAQWGAIGMLAARDIFGIPMPEWVRERNIVWLTNSQAQGAGFGYTTGGSSAAGTPSGLVQAIMDGIDKHDIRWEWAESWMANNWTNQYITNPSNRPYYPYYALTKAMRLALPTPVETFSATGLDWFRDAELGLARTLIDDQEPSGRFPGTQWISNQLRSAWGVIILSRTLFVQPPVADAGRDRVWGVDLPLQFDGSNSFHLDPFRDIVKYEWDFDGDGNFDFESDLPFATHTYALADYPENTLPVTINARLRVTDNNIPPLTDNDTAEIIIAIPPHPPIAEAGGPYTCTAGLPCPLDGSGSFDIDPTDFIFRYEWDLDGFPFDYTGAVGETPSPVFAEGLHNIGLRVFDNGVLNDLDGDSEVDENERLTDVDFATVTAVANQPPTADAGGPYVVDEGSSVQLDASGSSDPNGDPLVYEWDLDNDGQYDDALGLTPTFLGVDDGDYTVGLRVTDTLLSDTTTVIVTVNNVAPIVDAGIDQGADEGEVLNFASTFSDPGTQDTHTIEWDFGDGNSSTGTLTPSHAFAEDGIYTVTLTVTDDDGGVGVDLLEVIVGNLPPIVEAGADQPGVAFATPIALDPATFTDAGILDTHTATIDWGDGSSIEAGSVTQGAGSGSVAGGHTYAADGAYTVTVTVTDDEGASGSDTFLVTILNPAPVTDAGPDAGLIEGNTFTSTGSTLDADGDALSATVDYGEGAGSQALPLNADGSFALNNLYEEDGVYNVSVSVTDSDGGVGTDSLTVTVENAAPVVNAGADQTDIDVGAPVALDPATFTDAGVLDTHTATIDWGDGTPLQNVAVTQGAGNGSVPGNHNYAANGTYTVTVTVTDDEGASGSDTLLVLVDPEPNTPPVVDAGPDQAIELPNGATLDGTVIDDGNPNGTLVTLWTQTSGPGTATFADATAIDTTVTFSVEGTYVLRLTADDSALTGFDEMTVTVSPEPNTGPVVDAGPDQGIVLPNGATLDGTVTDDGNPNGTLVTLWTQTSGPGTVTFADATAVDTTVTFSEEGTYVLRLTADDSALTGFDEMTVTVSAEPNDPPVVDAGPDQSVVLPNGATLDGTVIDDGNPNGTLVTLWTQTSGPGTVTFADATAVDTTVTFSEEGTYVLRLTADDSALTGFDEMTVTVSPEPNVAPAVDAGPDATLTEGDTFSSGGSFSDPNADTWTATVDYGKGAGPQALPLNPDGSFALNNLYEEDGVYTVTVTVTDSAGGVGSDTAEITVGNAPPVVEAGANQSGVSIAQTVSLDPATFTDLGVLDTHTATIDWGDGSSVDTGGVTQGAGSGSVAGSHSYGSAGTFTVTVTVTDDEGASGSDTLTIVVAPAAQPETPEGLSARQKVTKVQLVWTHNGADSYNVYRSLTPGGGFTLLANTTSTYSTYLDEAVTTGTTYYYYVTSVLGGVESSPSVEVNATPTESRRRR